MLGRHRETFGALFAGLFTLSAGTSAEDQPDSLPAPAPEPSRFHITLGNDYTTAYYFRGIRQEDSGLILQPYADLALDFFRDDGATISAKLGVWNSFHGEAAAADTDDSFTKNWYECDLYAGVGAAIGKWTFDARYYFYTSPSGAFGTVDEVDLGAAFDDAEYLGPWSLKPSAVLAIETGSNASDGRGNGVYLQLGVAPGVVFQEAPLKNISLTFPVTLGLSLSNYYEGTDGENDAFGYASVGAKLAAPLNLEPSWGAWTLTAGVQGLFLGDAAESFNEGDSAEFIATFGVAVTF